MEVCMFMHAWVLLRCNCTANMLSALYRGRGVHVCACLNPFIAERGISIYLYTYIFVCNASGMQLCLIVCSYLLSAANKMATIRRHGLLLQFSTYSVIASCEPTSRAPCSGLRLSILNSLAITQLYLANVKSWSIVSNHKSTISFLRAQSPLTLHPPARCMHCTYALVVQ